MTVFRDIRGVISKLQSASATLHQFTMADGLTVGAATAGQNPLYPTSRRVYRVAATLDTASEGVDFTADATANTIVKASHGLVNGAKITVTSTGVLPAPLVAGTTYFVVGAASGTFQVALTSGGSAIDLTSTGSGTHTYHGTVTLTIKSASAVIATITIAEDDETHSVLVGDLGGAVLVAGELLGVAVTGAGVGAEGLAVDVELRGT